MKYRGYTIKKEREYYLVTCEDMQWTEDSVRDAKNTIDELEEGEHASIGD